MIAGLHAHDLSIERGGRLIVDRLSFSTLSGQALVLKGPNGAGKTTLLRALAGFLPLSNGQIELEGGDDELEIGAQCHYVGHANANKPSMTVAENLRFWCGFHGGAMERITEALEAFDLSRLAQIPASYLSAGQRRRLGLARLLVAERPLWLLDEPTTALDTDSQSALLKTCNRHLEAGGVIVAATHMPLAFENASELRLEMVGLPV